MEVLIGMRLAKYFKARGGIPPGRGLLRAAVLLLAAILLPNAGIIQAAETTLTEYQVKALFLLNFAKYVEWPAAAFPVSETPVTIGVMGENRFGDSLEKVVAGKKIGGRGIKVRYLEESADAGACQILFIGGSEKRREEEIISRMKGRPTLIVGETERFLEKGGMIEFKMKDGKVRLAIDIAHARSAEVQISSKLLGVADVVKGKE